MAVQSENYNLVAKIFHWVMALIMMGLILMGLYMTSLEYSPDKIKLIGLHKSFGLLILWMVGVRIIWSYISKRPIALPTHKSWEKILSKVIHVFLYIAMIGMPLSGWLMSSAGEYPVSFFGVPMPDLVDKNMDMAKLMNKTHEVLAYLLIFSVLLHIWGAFKHHFVDKDATLRRMALIKARFLPYLLVLIALGFFGVTALFISKNKLADNNSTKTVVKVEETENDNVSVEALSEHQWAIISSESEISFRGNVYGKDFTGAFPNFHGNIIFNPDDLGNSGADIFITLEDVATGDAERDVEILGAEWFHTEAFPQAQFKSIAFEKGDEGRYVAIGNLTIRDVTMPVSMPFSLDIRPDKKLGKRAIVKGRLDINRLSFQMGAGEWADPSVVGINIPIDVNLVAVSSN